MGPFYTSPGRREEVSWGEVFFLVGHHKQTRGGPHFWGASPTRGGAYMAFFLVKQKLTPRWGFFPHAPPPKGPLQKYPPNPPKKGGGFSIPPPIQKISPPLGFLHIRVLWGFLRSPQIPGPLSGLKNLLLGGLNPSPKPPLLFFGMRNISLWISPSRDDASGIDSSLTISLSFDR